MGKTNPNFLNGVPELLMLQLLSRREMYGYELVKALHSESDQTFDFAEGSIYPVLHSLEERKFVQSRRVETGGRTRTYYNLTDKGSRRLDELSEEWRKVEFGISVILKGKHA